MRKFYLVDTLGESDDESRAFIEDYVKGLEMDNYDTGHGVPTAQSWPKDAAIYLRKRPGRKLGELLGTITNVRDQHRHRPGGPRPGPRQRDLGEARGEVGVRALTARVGIDWSSL